jgi:hypothetical protein
MCGADKKWTLAAMCCGAGTCNHPPINPNVPYCTYCKASLPSPDTDQNTNHDSHAVEEFDPIPSESPSASFTPGAYQCRQPFTTGHLQVCNADGVWQISNECCGPYTCYDAPGDEPAHCMCQPEPGALGAIQKPASEKAVNVPQHNGRLEQRDGCKRGTYACNLPETATLCVCNAVGQWVLANDCCGLHTCYQGDTPGTAYCLC